MYKIDCFSCRIVKPCLRQEEKIAVFHCLYILKFIMNYSPRLEDGGRMQRVRILLSPVFKLFLWELIFAQLSLEVLYRDLAPGGRVGRGLSKGTSCEELSHESCFLINLNLNI